MPWPNSSRATGYVVTAANWNEISAALELWGGNTDAAGYNLNNCPLITGGSGTTSTLTLQPTSGNGGTGSDLIFKVGNNGAVQAMRVLADGSVGIGPSNTSPTGTLHVYNATAGTGVTTVRVRAGAGQSGAELQQWQDSSGTTFASLVKASYGANLILSTGTVNEGAYFSANGMLEAWFNTISSSNSAGKRVMRFGNAADVFSVQRLSDDSLSIQSTPFKLANDAPTDSLAIAASGAVTMAGTVAAGNFKRGTGSPENVVTGSVGDLYTRTDGGANTTLYVKESGNNSNTGWVAK